MELNEVRDIAQKNQQAITQFCEWSKSIERRVTELEKVNNLLVEVQITLSEIKSSNLFFGEKMSEMKKSLDKIYEENKAQHNALSDRIKKIEDAPGDKWNKAVWIIITAALMAASAGLTKMFAP